MEWAAALLVDLQIDLPSFFGQENHDDKYDKDGKLLAELGAKDKLTKRLGFLIPSGYFDVAIGREGQLWAVNPGMHAFEAYDESGEMISSWHKTSNKANSWRNRWFTTII